MRGHEARLEQLLGILGAHPDRFGREALIVQHLEELERVERFGSIEVHRFAVTGEEAPSRLIEEGGEPVCREVDCDPVLGLRVRLEHFLHRIHPLVPCPGLRELLDIDACILEIRLVDDHAVGGRLRGHHHDAAVLVPPERQRRSEIPLGELIEDRLAGKRFEAVREERHMSAREPGDIGRISSGDHQPELVLVVVEGNDLHVDGDVRMALLVIGHRRHEYVGLIRVIEPQHGERRLGLRPQRAQSHRQKKEHHQRCCLSLFHRLPP